MASSPRVRKPFVVPEADRCVPRKPLGVGVAHLLQGVAAAAEVARVVCHQFQLPGLHLRTVLRCLQVAEFGAQPVDATVEAPDPGVEGVDESLEQVFALVSELEAVGCGALGEDAEHLAHRVSAFVAVPDLAGVAPKNAAFSQTMAVGDCA